jgi:cardiolipin synthase (CMP-forming)
MNLAIALTLLRLVLVAPFAYCLIGQHYITGIIIFVFMSSTDILDGYVARRFNQKTRLGANLDPLTDKIFIFTGNLILVLQSAIPLWFFIFITAKDLTMIGGGLVLKIRKVEYEPQPNIFGKAAVFLQVVIILEGIVEKAFANLGPAILLTAIASSLLTLIAWVIYFKLFLTLLREKKA